MAHSWASMRLQDISIQTGGVQAELKGSLLQKQPRDAIFCGQAGHKVLQETSDQDVQGG